MKLVVQLLLACWPIYTYSQKTSEHFDTYDRLPIRVDRTVTFDTDEGSYMDIDVSPDGKTLAFCLLGDIYKVPVAGGKAIQITRGLPINLHPVWSPDGKYIAYTSDASGSLHLSVMNADGISQQKVDRSDNQTERGYEVPVWSPDGKFVVLGKYIYRLTGGKQTLTNDQKIIGFSALGQFGYIKENGGLTISRYDRNSGSKIKLLEHTIKQGRFTNAKVSPDGRWLTYMSDDYHAQGDEAYNSINDLILCDLDSGKEQALVALNIKFPGLAKTQNYSFSPDSESLYIGYGGKIHKIDLASKADLIIPFIATVNVDMGSLNYNRYEIAKDTAKVKFTRSANASPDGKHLVFAALNRLYIMDLPKGKPRVLVTQPDSQFHPTFSPDGKWIAYVTWKDLKGGHLWYVSVKGGSPNQVSKHPLLYEHPSWSPDSRSIAVLCSTKPVLVLQGRDGIGRGQLKIFELRGRTETTIAQNVFFSPPQFSRDGVRVLYKPSSDGLSPDGYTPKLVSKKIVGSKDIDTIAIGAFENELILSLRQVSYSPDGRYLVYLRNENLYLVPLFRMSAGDVIYDPKGTPKPIRFAEGGFDPHWEKEGKFLTWSFGNKFYRINPDRIIDNVIFLAKEKREEGLPGEQSIVAITAPDETISIDLTYIRPKSHKILALIGARIITMKGNQVIEHGTVLIKDDRIVAIDKPENIEIPSNATVINLGGKTIMPGLIDMHSHMDAIPPDIYPQQAWQLYVNLAYGVTTVRNPSANHDSFGYSELLGTGQMIGPRLYSVGASVREDRYSIDNLDDARLIAKNRSALGGTDMKQYLLDTRIKRQQLLLACRESGLNMTNEREDHPLLFVGQIKDGSTGIEHNPIWGDVYSDIFKLVAKSGTYLTPTIQVCAGRQEGKFYFRDKFLKNPDAKLIRFTPKKEIHTNSSIEEGKHYLDSGFLDQSRIDAAIHKAGGHLTLGSHGEDQGIGAHFELWALQMGGISNHDALRIATINGARALGVQSDLGSIEPGKIADLVILNSNPLDDIHNSKDIKYVMKDGILYDGETLNTIWPFKRKLPDWKLQNN